MSKKDDQDFYLKLFPILNQVGDIHVVNYLISSTEEYIYDMTRDIQDAQNFEKEMRLKPKESLKYKKIKKEYMFLLKTLKQFAKSMLKIEKMKLEL